MDKVLTATVPLLWCRRRAIRELNKYIVSESDLVTVTVLLNKKGYMMEIQRRGQFQNG
jgi:hypothetical protein